MILIMMPMVMTLIIIFLPIVIILIITIAMIMLIINTWTLITGWSCWSSTYFADHADHHQMDFDGRLVRHSAAITTQFVRDEHAELNDNDPLTWDQFVILICKSYNGNISKITPLSKGINVLGVPWLSKQKEKCDFYHPATTIALAREKHYNGTLGPDPYRNPNQL